MDLSQPLCLPDPSAAFGDQGRRLWRASVIAALTMSWVISWIIPPLLSPGVIPGGGIHPGVAPRAPSLLF